ncbi:MAG: T9SS type A sorting domain-containing protein, partial [Bacteroidota bacterium]
DISVLPPYATRGSAYDLPITLPITAVTGYAYGYNANPPGPSQNPSRSTFFACATPNPVAPPVTPGVFVPAFSSTYSFQIKGSPAMLAPGGTQDFYFTGTVPVTAGIGQTACNSYGIEVTPYGSTSCIKAESTPACVTVIPPDGNACDSIWGDTQISECCTFTTHILNTLGSISQLQYNVLPVGGGTMPGGVVQSVLTSPCVPSSTIPASLPGTTSGSLFFGPPCPSPLDVQIHATSTTASGLVCVELIATIIQADGTTIECSDTICFHCDPAPQDRCDSMLVKAYPNMNLSTRTFTIYNLKAPTSPICDVKINVTPPPPGSGLHGSNLVVDGTPQSWPYSSSAGYTQITGAHGLPANTMVQFDLGVDFGLGWIGNVVVTVDHCDGTSCTMRYGPWDASKKDKISVGSATDVPDRATLHMNSLTFSRSAAVGKHIRSIAVKYSDPVTAIVAVTGATYPCDIDNAEQGTCNDIFESVHVKDGTMMIDLRRDLDDDKNLNDPIVTVVYNATSAENPTAEIIYYDENGQEVGNDNVDVNGGDPPSQAISGLNGNDRMVAVLGALTAQPNPTSGRCDLGFTLPSAATVELELLDTRGTKVATVINGEHLAAGQYHRNVDLGSVPSGTYLVSLRVNGIPSVLRVELTK